MSSRHLWVCISRFIQKPDSMLAFALREGDWDTDQYLLQHIANELKCSRADFATANGAQMKPQLIKSPRQQAEDDNEQQRRSEVRSFIMGQLTGKFTPPPRDVTFTTETKRGNGFPGGGLV